ncbi:MAG: AraC family transcriptional regulator [Lachnospiraceae bacterium]|nr:AraC family transcriptional regulator [Lachnospiraceae bacterium]
MELTEAEKIYKVLYEQNPGVYTKPIDHWEDFRIRYGLVKNGQEEVPKRSPTYIEEWLGEEFFFRSLQEEVCLLENARFCPPFWHRLRFIKIVYVYSGSCLFYMDDQVTRLKRGAFCIVGPNVKQALASYSEQDRVINLIIRYSTFAESFFGLLMEQGAVSDFLWEMLYNQNENMALLYCGKERERLKDLVSQLLEENALEEEKSNLIMKSQLMLFFGEIFRTSKKNLQVWGKVHREVYLPSILCYIRDHLQTATLPELADKLKLSEGYVSRYIRRQTGHTFRDLLRDTRMNRAEKMLLNTDFSVDKVMETVGYTDKSRFYRNFAAKYGMAPGAYRKQQVAFRV